MNWIAVLLAAVSCVCIAGTEFAKRRWNLSSAHTRRAMHVGTALVAAVAPFFATRGEIVVISLIFAGAFFLARFSSVLSALRVERTTYGEIYLPLGVALSGFWFLPDHVTAFQFGVLVMGIADVAASYFGGLYGRHTITLFGGTKSLEGSLGFLASSSVLAFGCAPFGGIMLFFVSGILTVTEFCLPYGLDNLVLPSLGALLLRMFL